MTVKRTAGRFCILDLFESNDDIKDWHNSGLGIRGCKSRRLSKHAQGRSAFENEACFLI